MTDSEFKAIQREVREARIRAEHQFMASEPSDDESEHVHAQHAEYGGGAH